MQALQGLSTKQQSYIEALHELASSGEPVSTSDVSAHLKVSLPSASEAVSRLVKLGYIRRPSYRQIALTEKGTDIASNLSERHRTLGRFMVTVLGMTQDGADRDALGFDFPEKGTFIQTDISKSENVEKLFKAVAESTPSLNALVNNAAIQIAKPLLETTLEEWDTLMAINLRAIFYSIQQAYPLLKPVEGAIVNVSSVLAACPQMPWPKAILVCSVSSPS